MLPCAQSKGGEIISSLVYHAGALGDFLTALPAMAVWRRLHPGEHCILFGRPAHAALALPRFDEVWNVDDARWAPFFSSSPVRRPDAIPSSLSSALLFASSGSPLARNLSSWGVREVVRQAPFPDSPQPIVDYHLSIFPPAVLEDHDAQPRISLDGGEIEPGDLGVAALHPGSGSPSKNWPVAEFKELARRLTLSGMRVVWIRGPAEPPDAAPRGERVWDCLPLAVLAARLSRAAIYVGNDSGVTHLAAAAGCPTVALFGASDARTWAPRGRAVRVLVSPNVMHDISVEDSVEACRYFLSVE
jgi:ADP-heptose:LPS heptosyltransferase